MNSRSEQARESDAGDSSKPLDHDGGADDDNVKDIYLYNVLLLIGWRENEQLSLNKRSRNKWLTARIRKGLNGSRISWWYNGTYFYRVVRCFLQQ